MSIQPSPASDGRDSAMAFKPPPDRQHFEHYPHLTDPQLDLYDRMSEISEECFCAGWVHDNEYDIWDAIVNGESSRANRWMNPRLLRRCQLLSVEIKGWIYWADGPQFAPMSNRSLTDPKKH